MTDALITHGVLLSNLEKVKLNKLLNGWVTIMISDFPVYQAIGCHIALLAINVEELCCIEDGTDSFILRLEPLNISRIMSIFQTQFANKRMCISLLQILKCLKLEFNDVTVNNLLKLLQVQKHDAEMVELGVSILYQLCQGNVQLFQRVPALVDNNGFVMF